MPLVTYIGFYPPRRNWTLHDMQGASSAMGYKLARTVAWAVVVALVLVISVVLALFTSMILALAMLVARVLTMLCEYDRTHSRP
jgi:preprotein translocase subunit SecF